MTYLGVPGSSTTATSGDEGEYKAVCSAVGYTLDYILTKGRGLFVEIFNHIIQNLAVILGECWDLNRQFQECLP